MRNTQSVEQGHLNVQYQECKIGPFGWGIPRVQNKATWMSNTENTKHCHSDEEYQECKITYRYWRHIVFWSPWQGSTGSKSTDRLTRNFFDHRLIVYSWTHEKDFKKCWFKLSYISLLLKHRNDICSLAVTLFILYSLTARLPVKFDWVPSALSLCIKLRVRPIVSEAKKVYLSICKECTIQSIYIQLSSSNCINNITIQLKGTLTPHERQTKMTKFVESKTSCHLSIFQ